MLPFVFNAMICSSLVYSWSSVARRTCSDNLVTLKPAHVAPTRLSSSPRSRFCLLRERFTRDPSTRAAVQLNKKCLFFGTAPRCTPSSHPSSTRLFTAATGYRSNQCRLRACSHLRMRRRTPRFVNLLLLFRLLHPLPHRMFFSILRAYTPQNARYFG